MIYQEQLRRFSSQELAFFQFKHYEDYKFEMREKYGNSWQFSMSDEEKTELNKRDNNVDWGSL